MDAVDDDNFNYGALFGPLYSAIQTPPHTSTHRPSEDLLRASSAPRPSSSTEHTIEVETLQTTNVHNGETKVTVSLPTPIEQEQPLRPLEVSSVRAQHHPANSLENSIRPHPQASASVQSPTRSGFEGLSLDEHPDSTIRGVQNQPKAPPSRHVHEARELWLVILNERPVQREREYKTTVVGSHTDPHSAQASAWQFMLDRFSEVARMREIQQVGPSTDLDDVQDPGIYWKMSQGSTIAFRINSGFARAKVWVQAITLE